jgi:hypothetical protein
MKLILFGLKTLKNNFIKSKFKIKKSILNNKNSLLESTKIYLSIMKVITLKYYRNNKFSMLINGFQIAKTENILASLKKKYH